MQSQSDEEVLLLAKFVYCLYESISEVSSSPSSHQCNWCLSNSYDPNTDAISFAGLKSWLHILALAD